MSKAGKAKHLDYERLKLLLREYQCPCHNLTRTLSLFFFFLFSIRSTIACANKLLDQELIHFVFFATDSKTLEDLALSLISDEKAFLLIGNESLYCEFVYVLNKPINVNSFPQSYVCSRQRFRHFYRKQPPFPIAEWRHGLRAAGLVRSFLRPTHFLCVSA